MAAPTYLWQPILNPIPAFDASSSYTITFIVRGGTPVAGNRLVIYNNATGEVIYNKTQEGVQLQHILSGGILTNGTQYKVVVYTKDSQGNESVPSVPELFYCYTTPTIQITNIPTSKIIDSSIFEFQGSYFQSQSESLNSYQFILYDSNKQKVSQSDEIYFSSNPSLKWIVRGMNNEGTYYVSLNGSTVNGTKITTGLLDFSVDYPEPESFDVLSIESDCDNGYNNLISNLIVIGAIKFPSPLTYINNKEVDLSVEGSFIWWNSGFVIIDDFTMRVWGRRFTPSSKLIELSNDKSTTAKPKEIDLSWQIDGTIQKSYNSSANGYIRDIVNVKNAKQDHMTFTRMYGASYQQNVSNNSINMIGLKDSVFTRHGLTLKVENQEISLEGTMDYFAVSFSVPCETTYDLNIGDTYYAGYSSNTDLDGFNISMRTFSDKGAVMSTPNVPSQVASNQVEIEGVPQYLNIIIISENKTTVPQGTLLKCAFSKTAFTTQDIQPFYEQMPTVDRQSDIIYVGDKDTNGYRFGLAASEANLVETSYIYCRNATYTYDEEKGFYVAKPIVLNQESYVSIGIKNRMAYGQTYQFFVWYFGNVQGIKLYSTELNSKERQQEIPITDWKFAVPGIGHDLQLMIKLDSTYENEVEVKKIMFTSPSSEISFSPTKGNVKNMTISEPLRSCPNEHFRDVMQMESVNILNPSIQGGNIKSYESYTVVTRGLSAYLWFYDKDGILLNASNPISLPASGNNFRSYNNAATFKITRSSTNPDAGDISSSDIKNSQTAIVYYQDMEILPYLYYPYIYAPSIIRYIKRQVITSDNVPDIFPSIGSDYVQIIMDVAGMTTIASRTEICVTSNYFKGVSNSDYLSSSSSNIISNGTNVIMMNFPKKSRFMDDFSSGNIRNNFIAWIKEKEDSGNPFYIDYALDVPIVENLTYSQMETLQSVTSYGNDMYALTETEIRGALTVKFVTGEDYSQVNGAYASVRVTNGLGQESVYDSNLIPYPQVTDKIFIWLRKIGTNYEIMIENLGEYEDTTPIQINNGINSEPASQNPDGINFISVQNGIYDRINITSDTSFPYNPLFPTGWTKDTILNANFNGNPNAGNVMYTLTQINALKIKRRLKGTYNWMTLYEIPVNNINDIKFTKLDMMAQSNVEYEYALVLVIGNVESEYILNSAEASFYGIYITDGKQIYKFKEGTSYSGNQRIHVTGLYNPYGSKYPIIVSNGQINYCQGTVNGSIIVQDVIDQIDRISTVNKINEITNFLCEPSAKILKDWNGNSWMVDIMDNIPISYYTEAGMGFANISFNWAEIGDVNSGIDLFNNGFIYSND